MVEATRPSLAPNAAIDAAVNKVLDQAQADRTPEPTLGTPARKPSILGRAKLAGTLALSMVAAACGVGDKPPATPTTLPTNTPGATQSFEPSSAPPSFEVTPPPASPTPKPVEVTPSPKATPTELPLPSDAITIQQFYADLKAGGSALDKYKNSGITAEIMQRDFEAFMASSAAPKSNTQDEFRQNFRTCVQQIGTNDLDKLIVASGSLTTAGFYAQHIYPNSPEAARFTRDMVNWDLAKIYKNKDTLSLFLTTIQATAEAFGN